MRKLRSKAAPRALGWWGSPALALLAVLLSTPAAAQETRAPHPFSDGGTMGVTVENDLFGGDDRYYTSGIRVDYVTPRNDLPLLARIARRNLDWLTDAEDWYATFALGQNIYTPADIRMSEPDPGDRPYGGFLYGSVGIVADRGDRLDTIALDFGIVGPASQADDVQRIVHDIVGAPEPRGWDHQLWNEAAFRLLYERKYRFLSRIDLPFLDLEVDAAPNFSLALGNVDTSAGAGLTVRIGDRLEDNYGPTRIRPAVAGPGFFDPDDGLGWYLFASAEGRAVGRNIFIEGNTFRDSPGADPKRLVADLQAGFALQYGAAELSYTHVLRTKEFDGQDHPSEFGSVNLRVRF